MQIIVNKCVSATREKLSKKIDELTGKIICTGSIMHVYNKNGQSVHCTQPI